MPKTVNADYLRTTRNRMGRILFAFDTHDREALRKIL